MDAKKRLLSFVYAFQGLRELLKSQPNATLHLVAASLAVGAGFYLGISRLEWMAVAGCIAAVLAAEAFNTALEYLTDLVSPGHHPLAGKAKDVAAAGVLLTALGAAVVGLLIFLPKLNLLIG